MLNFRSKTCIISLMEVSFIAGTANHAAGASAVVNYTNLVNLETGARENKAVTVIVGSTALNAAAVADLWVVALNNALAEYGGVAIRAGATAYGNLLLALPYTDVAPYPAPALTNTSSMFAGFSNLLYANPLNEQDREVAEATALALQATNDDLRHQVDVLEVRIAASGGSSSPGSTSVVVNNPATDTAQTVMAAIAGFGIGFMLRGARQGDD